MSGQSGVVTACGNTSYAARSTPPADKMAELTQNAILRISDEKTLQLIELYQKEECLWNTTLEDYKNRDKRAEAANRIARELNLKNFGPKQVVSKIKNLRNSYCQELKKISFSYNAGAVNGDDFECYKPKVFWFSKMDSFLKPHLQTMKNFIQTNLTQQDDVEKDGEEVEEWVQMSNPEEVLIPDGLPMEPSCSENDEVDTAQTRKRKVLNETRGSKRAKMQEFQCGMHTQALRDISTQLSEALTTHNDCFDTFSRYVASLLRALPMQKAFMLQSKIVEMITTAGIEECNGQAPEKIS